MAVKILYLKLNEVLHEQYYRLDPKYYIVNHFFSSFTKRQKNVVSKLSDLTEQIISGSYVDTYVTKEQGIPYLRVSNIKPFSFDENENNLVYVSNKVDEKIKIKENDIVLPRTNSDVNKLGVSSIADIHHFNWATSQATTRIRVDKNKISLFYLVAYLNSKFFKTQVNLASQGTTRVEFTNSQMGNVKIFVPDSELYNDIIVQVKTIIKKNRTANDLIQEAKDILRETLALTTKKEKQVWFQVDLKTLKKTDIWNATYYLPFYSDAENELKSKFKTIELGEIVDVKKGNEVGRANYNNSMKKGKTDYAFIRTSDIINHEIDLYPDYFISKDVYNTLNQDLKAGDILFTKDGKIGQTAIVTEVDNSIISSGIARIRMYKNEFTISPEFLFIALSLKETGYNPAIRRTVIATTIPHLREERLKQIPIPILDKEIIDRITQKVKRAFELKNEKKKIMTNVLDTLNDEYEKMTKDISVNMEANT